ncbi:MAG: Clp1/GlmU family protein [Candidatus Bathycorpusculaceae bacterium]
MNRIVERGKTLLIEGPASVTIVKGRVEVFGFPAGSADRVVIREGKRLPFAVEETATFYICSDKDVSIEEVDGNTIPQSWIKSYEELLNLQEKPITIMILGTVDSGKTSYCTFLVNKLLTEKQKVAILDGDLGQSDIGPPCTVSYAFVTEPVTDLFNLKAEDAFFVGVTSPSKAIDKVITGLTTLKKEILSKSPDFIVINTDGWVEGEDAVRYKVQLVDRLEPHVIFCVQQKSELAPILDTIEEYRKKVVDSPQTIRQRTREKRKSLRELGYMKYLENARLRTLPLNSLRIEKNSFLSLGKKREDIQKTEEASREKIMLIGEGEEKGLLSAMYDFQGRFLGIGVLHEIDCLKKVLRVYTSVYEKVLTISIGSVRLNSNLREIPVTGE